MYHIIINPVAGHGRSVAWLAQLTALFAAEGRPYTVLTTGAPMDARIMARQACAEGSEGIIAVGGDGTMQEVVTGMWDAHGAAYNAGAAHGATHDIVHHHQRATPIPTPLGILPCGSGNDFVLSLAHNAHKANKKKNDRTPVESFYQRIVHNRTQAVDLICTGGMAFLNAANIGLDALIVRNAAALKHTFGQQAYMVAAFKSIVRHKNVPLTIRVNGTVITGEFTLLAVCNGQYYGGGMRIAPDAHIDDGQMNLCLVEHMSKSKAMMLFPSLLIGKHIYLREVRFLSCEQLTVTLPLTEFCCLDGNLYEDLFDKPHVDPHGRQHDRRDNFGDSGDRSNSGNRGDRGDRSDLGEITFTLIPRALRLFAGNVD